jgi:hypothetical protein
MAVHAAATISVQRLRLAAAMHITGCVGISATFVSLGFLDPSISPATAVVGPRAVTLWPSLLRKDATMVPRTLTDYWRVQNNITRASFAAAGFNFGT